MNYKHLCNSKVWFCVPKLPGIASYHVTIETDPSKTNLVLTCL